MKLKKILLASLVSAAIVVPQMASAESQLSFGGAGTVATAHLDFTVIIPGFVYFQVGSAGALDRVEWDLGASQPGQAVALNATGGDLDGADGQLSIVLWSNAGQVTLAVDNFSLTSGANTIPNTEILVSDTGTLTAPTTGVPATINTSGLASLSDTWTYQYADSAAYPLGTYNGTATYTATTL